MATIATGKPNRRKYQEVIAFLKGTLVNPKASLRIRYAAATRLDDIYRRAEEAAEKAAARKDRAEAKMLSAQEQQGAAETPQTLLHGQEQEPKSQVDIENFLKLIQKRPESTDAVAD